MGQYYCAISTAISVEHAAARNASPDSGSTLVNIIVQLPVSNNIAELPGLDHGSHNILFPIVREFRFPIVVKLSLRISKSPILDAAL